MYNYVHLSYEPFLADVMMNYKVKKLNFDCCFVLYLKKCKAKSTLILIKTIMYSI